MSWNGTLAFGAGRALFLGHAGDTSQHAHWAIQVAIGRDAPLRHDVGGVASIAAGVVVGSGVRHTLCADGARVVLLFVEPLSDLGRAASAFVGDPGVAVLDATVVRTVRRAAGNSADRVLDVASAALVRTFDGPASAAPGRESARVRAMVDSVERLLHGRVRLPDVAHAVGLSPSRLAALVRRTTGMALRPYVRWCRLRRATLAVVRGATLTEAAHEAGFADSAHLARTMRAAFGVTPSAVLSQAGGRAERARRAAPDIVSGTRAAPRSRAHQRAPDARRRTSTFRGPGPTGS